MLSQQQQQSYATLARPFKQIVAVGHEGVIGREGQLPWHLPNDLKNFKKQTQGHTVIMGRKTYESIGKPLPNRENWVVTTQKKGDFPCETFTSLNNVRIRALLEREKTPQQDFYVIGGSRLYQESLAYTQEILLTRVHGYFFGGDAFYPCNLKAEGFKLISVNPQDKAHSFELWKHESCLLPSDLPLT